MHRVMQMLKRFFKWLRAVHCNHAFYLDDLKRLSDAVVECPCCGCGKVMRADCGLNLPGIWLGSRPKQVPTTLPQEKV